MFTTVTHLATDLIYAKKQDSVHSMSETETLSLEK